MGWVINCSFSWIGNVKCDSLLTILISLSENQTTNFKNLFFELRKNILCKLTLPFSPHGWFFRLQSTTQKLPYITHMTECGNFFYVNKVNNIKNRDLDLYASKLRVKQKLQTKMAVKENITKQMFKTLQNF